MADPVSYLVQKGDTLGALAKRFNMTLDEFMSLNPEIKSPHKIFIGQKLRLKKPEPPPKESGGPVKRKLGGRGDVNSGFGVGESIVPQHGGPVKFGMPKTQERAVVNPTSEQLGKAGALLKEQIWRKGYEGEIDPVEIELGTVDLPQQQPQPEPAPPVGPPSRMKQIAGEGLAKGFLNMIPQTPISILPDATEQFEEVYGAPDVSKAVSFASQAFGNQQIDPASMSPEEAFVDNVTTFAPAVLGGTVGGVLGGIRAGGAAMQDSAASLVASTAKHAAKVKAFKAMEKRAEAAAAKRSNDPNFDPNFDPARKAIFGYRAKPDKTPLPQNRVSPAELRTVHEPHLEPQAKRLKLLTGKKLHARKELYKEQRKVRLKEPYIHKGGLDTAKQYRDLLRKADTQSVVIDNPESLGMVAPRVIITKGRGSPSKIDPKKVAESTDTVVLTQSQAAKVFKYLGLGG